MKKNSFISFLCVAFLCALIFADRAHSQWENPAQWIKKADALFEKGDFRASGRLFEKVLGVLDQDRQANLYLGVVIKLSQGYKALGYHKRALPIFKEAFPLLKKSKDRYLNVLFLTSLSDLYFTLGKMDQTVDYLAAALNEARLTKKARLMAAVLNDLGNGLAWSLDFEASVTAYEEALELLASEPGQAAFNLKTKALVNKIRTLGLAGKINEAVVLIEVAASELDGGPGASHYEAAANLLSFYGAIDDIRKSGAKIESEKRENLLSIGEAALESALEIAEKLGNDRLLSLAWGRLGQLREEESRNFKDKIKEAMNSTEKAAFFARRARAPEILYLWQWQMGRLFTLEKNIKKAEKYYKKSIDTLNPIRGALFSGRRLRKDFFNEKIKPVYLGLAKLLLKQGKMYAARDVMEILKTAELQDYFQNECAAPAQNAAKMDRTPKGAALFYPMAFKDSLVILATFPDGILQKKMAAPRKQVNHVVTNFRTGLQNRTNKMFMNDAQKLYDWMIRPFEEELEKHQIDTLVIAPDGALRLIPFSTLHDGERFLAEKYAMAVVPAISLTDLSELEWPENSEILITGLSEARQGFSALPGVKDELKDIKEIMNAKEYFSERQHNLKNLKDKFRNNSYSIVHMATHGVFGDSPETTFLLLYDGKLDMNGLSNLMGMGKFKKNKTELLTLSACQTALGDERAALGLAGAGVKAGVKSVAATLWFVDDEATSIAIREFYRQLKKPGLSKAKALKNAQKSLIAKKRYWHPAYWGPFLLIGNWM